MLITALAFLCLAGDTARGQESARRARGSWGMWVGLAQNSPTHLWGAEGGRDLAVLALRWRHPLSATGRVEWDYVLDLVPGAWLSMPRTGAQPPSWCVEREDGAPCTSYRAFEGAAAVHGLGVAPLGLQARVRAVAWAQPYLALTAGVLRFTRPVPVEGGARLNFSAEAGGGVLLRPPGRLGFVLGYKFYHLSNGGTAPRNPGLDGHMLVLGVQHTP